MKTYDIYTIIVKNTRGAWADYNGHGCFREDAYAEAWGLANKGIATGIRIDTYKHGKKLTPPVYSRTDILNAGEATMTEITKRIRYNSDTHDYDCWVSFDGASEEYIGSARTYALAELKLHEYALNYYADNATPETAAALVLAFV